MIGGGGGGNRAGLPHPLSGLGSVRSLQEVAVAFCGHTASFY